MRALFFVLILANLGFGAWAMWFSGPEPATRPISGGAPLIEMYAVNDSETQEVPVLGQTLPAPPIDDNVECISVGPLPNRVDVEDTVRSLESSGFASRQRTAQGEVWLGYWVYIDAIDTQTQAVDIVAMLAENSISEAYVIADGDNGSIVSLGVFSEQGRAQQRFADASALGLTPLISNRSQPGEVFWLDVTSASGGDFAIAELPPVDIDPQLRFETCSSTR